MTSDDPEKIYDKFMDGILRDLVQHVSRKKRQKGRSHVQRDRKTLMSKQAKRMKKLKKLTNENNKQAMRAKIVKIEAFGVLFFFASFLRFCCGANLSIDR